MSGDFIGDLFKIGLLVSFDLPKQPKLPIRVESPGEEALVYWHSAPSVRSLPRLKHVSRRKAAREQRFFCACVMRSFDVIINVSIEHPDTGGGKGSLDVASIAA